MIVVVPRSFRARGTGTENGKQKERESSSERQMRRETQIRRQKQNRREKAIERESGGDCWCRRTWLTCEGLVLVNVEQKCDELESAPPNVINTVP